ncbi:thermonuclease family protein [Brevundimonas nasdae]|uniref:Thermonuclease family protein n=1 Tax=Brevundimonas nasdae TaxID=172043 RepID=A0ABX8TKH2_9CAUL|nr:thermonuclease family protein [Brevundimonas nasdae]QYC14297.1 thermonuclease family protein [Brevundimonas nasdae]
MIAAVLVCTSLLMSDGDSGRCRLQSGETQRVRLQGIDAAEVSPYTRCRQRPTIWACSAAARPWGPRATVRARELASQGAVCTVLDTDRYGRHVATCRVSAGDLGGILVREGLAISDPGYANPYGDEQAEAQRRRRGYWASR